jgi:hypothetical protein
MPAKAKKIPQSKRAPKAKRKKVLLHTFYLLQPLLQFFALIAVMLIFARCSPLSPSTQKGSALQTSGPVSVGVSELAEAAALEEAFLNNLKELSSTEIEVISETDQEMVASNAPHVDEPMNEAGIRSLFAQRNRKGVKLLSKPPQVLYLPLDQNSHEAFFVNNVLRIDLAERLKANTKEKARRLLFKNLIESVDNKKLGASALLVLPDATMERVHGAFSELKLQVRISISVPSEDKAYLEIRRLEDDSSQARNNAVLLEAALKEAARLSILLE